MSERIDLAGKRFGSLSVLNKFISKNGGASWLVRCDCGTEKYVKSKELRYGKTTSCGCSRKNKYPNTGSRTMISNGKRFILKNEHPRGGRDGYVLEHVLVAEKVLGKYLPERAVVHHSNGDSLDNRKENLVICQDQTYHLFLHQRTRAYYATGNPSMLKCSYCKKYDLQQNLVIYKTKTGRNIYHRECQNNHRKKVRKSKKQN